MYFLSQHLTLGVPCLVDLSLHAFMPHLRDLRIDDVHVTATLITISLSTAARTAACPMCQQHTTTLHSYYARTIADLPWSGVRVALHVRSRKFYCPNPACARTIFCERLPDLVAVYGRRTHRLQDLLQQIGRALAGRAGARLAAAQAFAASRMSLLRLLRRLTAPSAPPPRVLGVDDYAQRKGQVYGTLLTDLERRCPVDLLPDRTADTFAAWLEAHPGVEVISRDRAGAYAEGARRGAPQAVQVADRFHVVKNLGDTVEEILTRHHAKLRETNRVRAATAFPPEAVDTAPEPQAAQTLRLTRVQQQQQARRARRRARYEEVMDLYKVGQSQRAIARTLGLSRHTVQRFVQAGGFPERQARAPRTPLWAPFTSYLRDRWDAGCHDVATLWREIRAQGYTGSQSGLRHHLAGWRSAPGRPGPRPRGAQPPHAAPICPPAPPPQRPFSARQTKWLLLRPPEDLDQDEQAFLTRLCEGCDDVSTTYQLAQEFLCLMRERDQAALGSWLERAESSGIPEVRGFAGGIRKDRDAVEAALTTEWSNGQVEGQVNKLKTLKRQMYGRAGFDLLRQRVLNAA